VPDKLRLRFGDDEYPRADIPYTLTIDGEELTGTTDAKGELWHYLSPNARHAELVLRPKDAPEEIYALELRGLDPVTEVSGVQGRLRNLHYYSGPVDGRLDAETVRAMRELQVARGIAETAEPDDATRQALLDAHGC
jgi:peptidoglycan hydrolase-like protein with peptidoglycan-binding domain